jgi:Calcineurin-like phosphoesterase
MSRTIIVGDVHGCLEELEQLFERVGLTGSDQVVMVGDLVVRGPDPAGVLALVRRVGARSVRGNHEDRLLRKPEAALGSMHKLTARQLKKRDWATLAALPLWIDLPDHDVRVVHAGVVPNIPIEQQDPRALMYMRSLGRFGEAVESRGRVPWGERYHGSPHVVFGHNAMEEAQIHRAATGIDTGCVYGGRLTAMVLRAGERPPPLADRSSVLVSVPARRRYADR